MKCYMDKEFEIETINKMTKVGISIKSIPTCFLSSLKVWQFVWNLVMVVKKLYHFKLKFFSKRTSSIYFLSLSLRILSYHRLCKMQNKQFSNVHVRFES